MDSLIELFCDLDDFCQSFPPVWRKQLLNAGEIQRQRERSLSMSEIMTILSIFINQATVISKPTTPNRFLSVCALNFPVWSVITVLSS